MLQWVAGNEEECWSDALAVERDRESQRRRASNRTGPIERRTKPPNTTGSNSPPTATDTAETKQKHLRVKRLVNYGEWSKAMGALLSNGTADITDNVLSQLREKHPTRTEPIAHPGPYPGWSDSTKNTHAPNSMELDPDTDDPNGGVDSQDSHQPATHMNMNIDQGGLRAPLTENTTLNYPSLVVKTKDILQAAKGARKLTSGGLQQITPWHLKRALLSSSNENCASTAAHLATRWAKGDYCVSLGGMTAESKLIP